MSITKIDDKKLLDQGAYHVCLDDIPKKSGDAMKEFMDYIPRQVIIPKINEVIDSMTDFEGKTYNKTETDTMLGSKADAKSVYTKAEADALLKDKADASGVYTKAEANALLKDKADAEDVYTKDEVFNRTASNMRFALKSEIVPPQIVDVTALPTPNESNSNKVYRKGGKLYECFLESEVICDGSVESLVPLPCKYKDVDELTAVLDALEFYRPINIETDMPEDYEVYGLVSIYDTDDESSELEIIRKNGSYKLVFNEDKYLPYECYGEWRLDDWVYGAIYLDTLLEASGATLSNYSNVHSELLNTREYAISEIMTKKHLNVSESEYELIEDITTSEPMAKIEKSTEPDGKAYNFTSIFVKFSIPQVAATTSLRLLISKAFMVQIANAINASWDARSTAELVYKPSLKGYKFTATQNTNSFGNAVNETTAWQFNQAPIINAIDIYSANNTELPTGTRVEIYGIRAQD